MPAYVLPQVLVFQDFNIAPAAAANPLPAHIAGPQAQLIRYAEEDEQAQGLLGYYDRLADAVYNWPNRPAGGINDPGYTKVWCQDALLYYFEDDIGGGSVITKVAGYNNRIHSASLNFASSGGNPRDPRFYDRDVRPGDVARVRGVSAGGTSITLWTYVKDLLADQVASTVGPATVDASNPSGQAASTSVAQVAGPENCVTPTPNGAAYDGLTSGYINETYDLLVLQGSVGGDYTTASLRVISGSGSDDVATLVPAAAGQPTAVGTRGLTVTFSVTHTAACSASATKESIPPDDLAAGQRWSVAVHAAYAPAAATSGGTYTGAPDTTYIVAVSRGGLFTAAQKPQIKVSTTNGVDLSGPATVTGPGVAVPAGTQGVTIAFAGTGLRAGNRFYVDVTGTADGPVRVIDLGNNLDPAIPDGSEVELLLFIRTPLLQVPRNRAGAAPLTNWDPAEETITIHPGVTAYDASWTQNGQPLPLPLWSEPGQGFGQVYAEVRYWLPALAYDVHSISDVSAIDDAIPGPLTPDNPLKYGVFKALENSNGTAVMYTAVANPDDDSSWVSVLELLLGRDDVYGLVPLTRSQTVLEAYQAHAAAQAAPEEALWRVVWFNLTGCPEAPVVAAGSTVPGHTRPTTGDGNVALGTIAQDPQAAGTAYTILICTSGNARFIANGVRPGDIARVLYTSDGFGGEEYQEFVVDEVQSEDQLRLLSGPPGPITVGAKFEVWRNLSAQEEAATVAGVASAWADRRVRAVWPEQVEDSGTVAEGYFLCAALAGLSSGILPHQGMTRLEVVGFSDVTSLRADFGRSQFDFMAGNGVWVVTQNPPAGGARGAVFTRHAVTTGDYNDINAREEVLTRNVDSISFRFKDQFKPYIGVTNVTPSIQARLRLEASNLIDALASESATLNLGGQLIAGKVVDVRPHAVFQDRYVMQIALTVPYPFNNVEIHLMI